MKDHTETLVEIMLRAEKFCASIESASQDVAPNPEKEQFRGKLGFCRTQLSHLQKIHDRNQLTIQNPRVREGFRHLIIGLMWVAFYARGAVSYRTYRMIVMIESSFTYVLLNSIPKFKSNGSS